MKEVIDLLSSYWYYFAPLLIIILCILYYLVQKGYIKEINVLGIKIEFNLANKEIPEHHPKESKTEVADKKTPYYSDSDAISISDDLKDYKKTFSATSIEQMSLLGLTQERLIELIQKEFLSHLTYFRYDILDYPLPVQSQYIVILDKVEKNITIRAVQPAKWTEVEFASWSSVLGLYRRATRYKYRSEADYIITPEVLKIIRMNHYEIIKQILRHLCQYNKNFLSIDRYTHGKGRKFGLGENISSYIYGADSIIYIHTTENGESKSIEKEITNLSKKYWKFTDDYKFVITNITLSLLSLNNIDNLKADMENQVISQKIGDSEIVLALELSLQYLHKIILSII